MNHCVSLQHILSAPSGPLPPQYYVVMRPADQLLPEYPEFPDVFPFSSVPFVAPESIPVENKSNFMQMRRRRRSDP